MWTFVLASEEVTILMADNVICWTGPAQALHATHSHQLAPTGGSSVAMVLPLARDAMRVLSVVGECTKELVVHALVDALEAFSEHKVLQEVRLASDWTRLRQQQDEEYALAADREAELARQIREEQNEPSPPEGPPQAIEEARAESARKLLAQELAHGFECAPPPSGQAARLSPRLPWASGWNTHLRLTLLCLVYEWATCCQFLPEAHGRTFELPSSFELTLAFPRRVLGMDLGSQTLGELGLAPSAALLLVEKEEEED